MSILEASTKTGLRPLLVGAKAANALQSEALHLKSWDLDARQTCDLELLLNGGFTPLAGFLGRKDYESVLERSRLADGTLWPIPITLDVGEDFAAGLAVGERIVLRHAEGIALAVLTVSDLWRPDRVA